MGKLAWAILLALAVALMGAAVFIWVFGAIGIELDDWAFYLSSPLELLAALGLVIFTFFTGSKRSRGGVWIALTIFLAIVIYLLNYLYPTKPDSVELGELTAAVENNRKVLLIGVDAMTWNRVLPLVRRGMLPNIERLMDEGAYGVLQSYKFFRADVEQWGFWSPVVWTTIATGVYPERHGILDSHLPRVVEKVPMTKRPPRKKKLGVLANSQHRQAPAFWNIYSNYGKSVGVVGWWASWPAEGVQGVLVSSNLGLRGRRRSGSSGLNDADWFTKRERLVYPESYVNTILEEIGLPEDTEASVNKNVFPLEEYAFLKGRDKDQFYRVMWQDRLYQQITVHLLRNEDFSIYTTYFEGVDGASHKFWRYMACPNRKVPVLLPEGFDLHRRVVDRYYAVVDSYIGELLEAAGDDTTIVICSDHGFRKTPEGRAPANHSGYGVLIIKGPGVRKGGNQLSLHGAAYDFAHGGVGVEDVLPTLLYMQGLPISEELDGTVQYRFFERAYLKSHPEIRTASYGDFFHSGPVEFEIPPRDRDEYRERLRSLGYIN